MEKIAKIINDEMERYSIVWIKRSTSWGKCYWCLHNGFLIISWICSLGVISVIPIFYMYKNQSSNLCDTIIISATGLGLILQLLDSILFFKDRATRARKMASELKLALLKYQNGFLSRKEMSDAIGQYLNKDWDEECA
ncbi:MAG: hypothetical protein GX416_06395 [Bacteroidales bacterium]|nr:hypothetical protein [Bacteroidales bacterium]